jgi:hypothetical protein
LPHFIVGAVLQDKTNGEEIKTEYQLKDYISTIGAMVL